ncbi:transport and Golgi organization protein 11 [Schistocerca americana]|uniref:transport and Golgi organization protein 11 n=1 Tax=Schistocerca americana TaxID=7009 RepID=UPI001F4FDEB3|nr:transport and Golgi organization protein 11 [Schistocerca americana]XP_046990385.1 transport and Golgi organization protein 11 [Schistocerca americana]XP_047108100.1 transport and Golgi organization protein 11 [Schistocerca piceifrons]XP_047108101.1 transport and Golgi organization protein 11 [Schistocerca piceifrons]XP_049951490.1 transport and Golgi organization protein 11 [Schistocerca serialis cubense]XP_049951491.1 transport and Golgi organization protein 11 [Schistocerca serialis cube
MSTEGSPIHLVDELKGTLYDPEYTAYINQRMRVPERLRIDGSSDELYNSTIMPNEVFDMRVPERIVVAGNEQHIGIKGIPREIEYENSIMPLKESVRVKTPPSVIRLDEYPFPSAFEFTSEAPAEKPGALVKPKPRVDQKLINREATPPIGPAEGLSYNEEITHLRRQMAKLNRRVMAIELDNIKRQQREKIILACGLAYIVLKTLIWLNRSQ